MSEDMAPHFSEARDDTSRWLRERALPLWASRGFDRRRSAFEEQLDFSGEPVISAPRRMMVQARQISVYAAAALSGAFPAGAEIALHAARSMIDGYFEADGAPGWTFSCDRSGRVVDAKRDLYAHAFAIFGLAWAMRLERDRRSEAALAATFDVLDRHFADVENGGYWDCLPRPDALRRQNPHMHLFEACLALHETTRRDEPLERCLKLRDHIVSHCVDPSTGAIREHFDDRWNVHPSPGEGSVEPGHLFEWAWLLRRFEAASGLNQDEPVSAMVATAMRTGLDAARGRIVDEVGEDGRVRAASSRSWPHTEALKALVTESKRTGTDHSGTLAAILTRLRGVYCVDRLEGGWIDHVDAEDVPISKVMPASTLYHLYFGIASLEEFRGR